MGATSVTGKGLGSAVGSQKGSEHMTLGAEKLVGPRVVACDEFTLDGSGDGVVVLPFLGGVVGDYVVMASDTDATAANAVGASMAMDSTSTTLTLIGTASQTVAYSVVKKGLAV